MKVKKRSFFIPLFFCVTLLTAPVCTGEQSARDSGGEVKVPKISGLQALLQRLAEKTSDIKSLKTEFVQEKSLSIFKGKIVLKGKIYLQKPYRIAWHVDEPIKYRILITDHFIRQWDEDTKEVQEISAAGNPVFRNIIKQLSVWFSGNYASLTEDYEVTVKNQSPVIIEFVPRETSMARKVLNSITVVFREDERYISQIKFQEISGDRTVITLENTVLNPHLDDTYFNVDPDKKKMSGLEAPGEHRTLHAQQYGKDMVFDGVRRV